MLSALRVCSSFTASGCTDGPTQALDIAVVFEVDQALSAKWSADGIFGTNPEQALEDDEVGTFTKFLGSFQKSVYSLTIDRRDFSQSANQPAGSLTVGGSSDAGCDGKWFTVDGGPYTQYGIGIVGTEFGTSVSQDKHDTYLTYSTAYLHVSSDLLNTVVIALHAEYDFPSDQYLVDCGAMNTAPRLALFTAAGTPLVVPPTDYIRQFTPNGKCVLMFTDEDLQIGSVWYLGSTLLRGYCMRYDDYSWTLQFSKKLVT
ncbi:CRE-ASP-1 protein [Aphelenchoides avenae]|nr:CRE-ASP-1 protein [Aphelenchus avenae]